MSDAAESGVLRDRGVLITGGSAGIGKAIAKACTAAGADVAICGRSADTVEKAKAEIEAVAAVGQQVLAIEADVSDRGAVDQMVARALAELPNFAGLVNCAGILGPKGALDEVDAEDWIATIQVNLIGTMLTCRAVLPSLRARGYGKIVNFSGGGATSPRPRFSAYAASKAAIVRLTENLAQELDGTGIWVNAIAPGAVNTRMLEEVLEAGPEKVGESAYQDAVKQKASGGIPAEKAAALCVMLLSGASDGLTGRLISAVWDAWVSLPAHKSELASSDVYTLRRIAPADRGLNWA
jgi:NAD(P)-dependent dehydrogenase (short-subunit alcohol dehydrogenase family)